MLAEGEEASASDAALVDEAILACFEQLRAEGVALFEVSSIPEWAQLGFRDYCAGSLVYAFGVSPQRRAELLAMADRGLMTLRRQTASSMKGWPVKAEYF